MPMTLGSICILLFKSLVILAFGVDWIRSELVYKYRCRLINMLYEYRRDTEVYKKLNAAYERWSYGYMMFGLLTKWTFKSFYPEAVNPEKWR